MNDARILDYQISKASFWSAIILIMSGLLIARPLFRLTLSAKIAAVGFASYGLLQEVDGVRG